MQVADFAARCGPSAIARSEARGDFGEGVDKWKAIFDIYYTATSAILKIG